jgi:hypothetical protein
MQYSNPAQSLFYAMEILISFKRISQFPQVSEQITKKSAEITSNVIRSAGIFNQLSVNALDAARENVKIYNRTVDAVTDFNNLLKTWTSYWSAQQQQFYRA